MTGLLDLIPLSGLGRTQLAKCRLSIQEVRAEDPAPHELGATLPGATAPQAQSWK